MFFVKKKPNKFSSQWTCCINATHLRLLSQFSTILFHRVLEHPELEGIHQGHEGSTPGGLMTSIKKIMIIFPVRIKSVLLTLFSPVHSYEEKALHLISQKILSSSKFKCSC